MGGVNRSGNYVKGAMIMAALGNLFVGMFGALFLIWAVGQLFTDPIPRERMTTGMVDYVLQQ